MFAFARVALIRLLRDRTNVFFMVLFPLLIVLLIGMQFSTTDTTRIGIVEGGDPALVANVRAGLEASDTDLELVDLDDEGAARGAVEEQDVAIALVFPPTDVEVSGDATARIALIANPGTSDLGARSVVESVVAEVDAPLRARRALLAAGVVTDPTVAAELVTAAPVAGPTVSAVTVGEEGLEAEFAGLGQFDLGASTQLLLFVFITAMTGSAAVVQARRWGVLDRVLAGPTAPGTVVAGLALGQLTVAGVQALVIVATTTLLFGVDWGDPIASAAVVVTFSMVAAAAGLLVGALLRNEEQAGGIGVPVSLGLAALGGCMVPLELFPTTLRQIANLTPHAWGNVAFAEIVRRDGTLLDVLPQLAVLLAFAAVFGVLASRALRSRLGIEA